MTDRLTASTWTPPGVSLITRFRRWEASGVLFALLLLSALLALTSPNFLTLTNIPIVLRNASFVGMVALGETLVVLVGGIDLSVGTIFGALLLTVLQNGTVLLNVSGYWERIIIGAVVLVAVLVDLLRRK